MESLKDEEAKKFKKTESWKDKELKRQPCQNDNKVEMTKRWKEGKTKRWETDSWKDRKQNKALKRAYIRAPCASGLGSCS